MKLPTLISLILFTLSTRLCGQTALEISRMGEWTIITPEDAPLSEKYAAAEFQEHFEKATGLHLSIESKPLQPTHHIFIGANQSSAPTPLQLSIDDLGDEGHRIRITTDNIAIVGGRPRGTLYGVYDFLERQLGIRFLTFDHTFVPDQAKGKLVCGDWVYIPPFSFRWSYYKENSDHPEFAARLRINTVTHADKLGGVTPQSLISHTLGHFLPASRYGKDHPEYFALVDGERKLEMGGGGPEPCVTNPEVIDIVAQNVIKELDEHPGQKNISVSQNDNAAYCRCDRCEAISQREGTPMGSHLAFVNAVAERVEKKYPNVKIGTLAYWYTRKAPKTIRPRPNVQIQLCSIECSTLFPLDDAACSKNRSFCEDMNAWGQICNDMWIWNYNTNFRYYDLPFPNLRVITPNIRYFLKNRVKGVFMQANGNGNAGEMCDLRNYVLSRCLWDPNLDGWELAKEFCRLHYGKAGETVIEYLTYLHENAVASGYEPTCFPMPFEVGINPVSAERIFGYFQKALEQADNELVRNRVEKASICSYRAALEVCGTFEFHDGQLKVVYPPQFGNLVADYIALTKKHGQTRAEEWQPIDHFYKIIEKSAKEGYRAEQLENETWRLSVLASDEGKIVELHHKPSGRDLLSPPGFRSLRHLFENFTLSELNEQGFDAKHFGPFEIRKEGGTVVLSKADKEGSKLERRIWLDEKDTSSIHFATQIANASGSLKKYQLRVRPEFYVGTTGREHENVSIHLKGGGWTGILAATQSESTPSLDQTAPENDGGYAIFNRQDGFGIQLTYDSSRCDRPKLSWSDRYPQANLDFHTQAVELKTGESFSFKYQLKYLTEPPR